MQTTNQENQTNQDKALRPVGSAVRRVQDTIQDTISDMLGIDKRLLN